MPQFSHLAPTQKHHRLATELESRYKKRPDLRCVIIKGLYYVGARRCPDITIFYGHCRYSNPLKLF